MRIVKLLVGTGIAAMVFAVAAAAPAYADKEFEIVEPGGGAPCVDCLDTGYEGDFAVFNGETFHTSCDVRFDIVIQADGSFETTNTVVDSCSSFGLVACDAPWPGQVRIPDTGPTEVDLEMCIENSWGGDVPFDVTTQAFESPRRWEQVGSGHSPATSATIEGLQVEDKEESDNVWVHLLP